MSFGSGSEFLNAHRNVQADWPGLKKVPLLRLVDALGRDEINLVEFTSASQASNLLSVAQYDGKEASLNLT